MKDWLEHARRGDFGAPVRFADQDPVFDRGDPVKGVYVLVEGAVELVQQRDDGGSAVVKILVAPTQFGVAESIAGEPGYLVSVRSLKNAVVHLVPVEKAQSILQNNHSLALETLRDTCQAFCRAARHEPARLSSTEVLLACLLLAYLRVVGDPENGVIDLVRNQAEFAGCVGASERQVHRVLGQWKKEGWIDKKSGRTVILNQEALKDIASPLSDALVHSGG